MGVLSGKVVIVTGATSGIGKGCAIEMAKAGAKVVATGRHEERGANTVRLVKEVGGDVIFVRQDVTQEADWVKVMDTTLSTYGRLDCLLNNAGEAVVKPLEQLTIDHLQFLLRVDLEGPFLGMKHAWPHLKKAGGGTIMNMSSITGQKGGPKGSAYCAAKGAQLGLTRAGALEGAPFNIRVNSIHPGMIWTEGIPDVMGPNPETYRHLLEATVPTKVLGETWHVGTAAVYLASDEAAYITGAEFNVDGGKSAT
ncbi:MAG: SDR family oxidoreductase [Rhodospirillaceae bacterium]|nr:SDR family oxidoreductase [Rhodospirillaceae bacterium]